MNQTLLIIGAGIEACEGIKIAKSMGLKLVIVDGNPHAPGFVYADHALTISTYDGEEITVQAIKLQDSGVHIHGVIAMCSDVPLSVAMVANKFNLPGLNLESALWVSDKLLMKEQLQKMDIPIPNFSSVDSAIEVKSLTKIFGYPFIIKPVDSRGARGVQLIDVETQIDKAFIQAKLESPTGRVMIEEYLAGPQVSTETLIDNGKCFTLGFSDRNYEWLAKTKPYIIENGGDSPSKLQLNEQSEIVQTVEKAALALGITQGVAKGDMVLTNEGAKVIEIAGRLSGGYFSTTQIPLATGVNFIEQAIKLALGEQLQIQDITPKHHKAVAIRYLDIPPGKIKHIEGTQSAMNSQGVELLSMLINTGDNSNALVNHTQRAGFAICSAETKSEAIVRAQTALNLIKIEFYDE